MVIEVGFQTSKDAQDPHSNFTETKYFEIDQMPDRNTVIQKLKSMGVDFDEDSVSIEAYNESAENMRKAHIPVLKF